MNVINENECCEVNGAISLGSALSAIAVGFFTGGPVGVGFAVSTVIMAQGIDNLHDLYK